jgi:hypothetical protein
MNDQGIRRLGKQCRERWYNHLSPDVRKDPWTDEEDKVIIEAHNKFGSKWTAISSLLKGRTPNAIKNRWNSTLKRVLLTGGTIKKKRKSTDEKALVEKLPDEIPPEVLTIKRRRSNNDIYGSNECLSEMLFNDSIDSDVFQHGNPYYFQLIPPLDDYLSSNFYSQTIGNSLLDRSCGREDMGGNPNYESPRHDSASPHLQGDHHNEFWNPEVLHSHTNLWSDEMHEPHMNWIV